MGKPVVTLTWNGNGPAHSGAATIRPSRAGFLVDDEVDTYGPFATLDEALALGTFHFGGMPGPALTCSPEIAATAALQSAALDLAGGPGGEVWINGVRHFSNGQGVLISR